MIVVANCSLKCSSTQCALARLFSLTPLHNDAAGSSYPLVVVLRVMFPGFQFPCALRGPAAFQLDFVPLPPKQVLGLSACVRVAPSQSVKELLQLTDVVAYVNALHLSTRSADLNEVRAFFAGTLVHAYDLPEATSILLQDVIRRHIEAVLAVPLYRQVSPAVVPVVLVMGCVPYFFEQTTMVHLVLTLLKHANCVPEDTINAPCLLAVRPQRRRRTHERRAAKQYQSDGPAPPSALCGLWFVELDDRFTPCIDALLGFHRRVLISTKRIVISPDADALTRWTASRDELLQGILTEAPEARAHAHSRFTKGLAAMTVERCNTPLRLQEVADSALCIDSD
jgi:hypothetical protein